MWPLSFRALILCVLSLFLPLDNPLSQLIKIADLDICNSDVSLHSWLSIARSDLFNYLRRTAQAGEPRVGSALETPDVEPLKVFLVVIISVWGLSNLFFFS